MAEDVLLVRIAEFQKRKRDRGVFAAIRQITAQLDYGELSAACVWIYYDVFHITDLLTALIEHACVQDLTYVNWVLLVIYRACLVCPERACKKRACHAQTNSWYQESMFHIQFFPLFIRVVCLAG